MRLLKATKMTLLFLFMFLSSGLDNVLSKSQVSVTIAETQKGLAHGYDLPAYRSVSPISQVVDTFFSAAHRWLDLSAAEVVLVPKLPEPKRPVQPTCSPLDSPIYANISRMIPDPPHFLDLAPLSPPATFYAMVVFNPLELKTIVVAWVAISLFIVGLFLLLQERTWAMLLDVIYALSGCFRIIIGVISCGLLTHYQLSKNTSPQGALVAIAVMFYMLGEIRVLDTLCRIGMVVRT
jgi:hypothetical protein